MQCRVVSHPQGVDEKDEAGRDCHGRTKHGEKVVGLTEEGEEHHDGREEGADALHHKAASGLVLVLCDSDEGRAYSVLSACNVFVVLRSEETS